jgi:predicted nucleic acid-binding Zn ribbon protein
VPIYEYQCKKCGEVFEASGWYLTDYARRSSSSSQDKPKSSEGTGKPAETKASTETKSTDKSPENKT